MIVRSTKQSLQVKSKCFLFFFLGGWIFLNSEEYVKFKKLTASVCTDFFRPAFQLYLLPHQDHEPRSAPGAPSLATAHPPPID